MPSLRWVLDPKQYRRAGSSLMRGGADRMVRNGTQEERVSGWGCVHEAEGRCTRVAGRPCDPGMKGCVLAGRFRFSNEAKNRPPPDAKPGPAKPPCPEDDPGP